SKGRWGKLASLQTKRPAEVHVRDNRNSLPNLEVEEVMVIGHNKIGVACRAAHSKIRLSSGSAVSAVTRICGTTIPLPRDAGYGSYSRLHSILRPSETHAENGGHFLNDRGETIRRKRPRRAACQGAALRPFGNSKAVPRIVPAGTSREHVHPHTFRHQMLTWLTAQGLPDAAIQLISGHASK